MDVGGKLLTKLLTQAISLKQVKLQEFFRAVEGIKEEMCYVSQDLKGDMARGDHPVEYYALPDPDIKRKG